MNDEQLHTLADLQAFVTGIVVERRPVKTLRRFSTKLHLGAAHNSH